MAPEQASSLDVGSKEPEQPTLANPVSGAEDAADPDEDDLDDLDDMLDEFSSTKIDDKRPTEASASGETPTPASDSAKATAPLDTEVPLVGAEDISEDEFQKQLQAGMAELMGDLEGSPEMQAQFENIFKGLGASAAETSSGSAPSAEQMASDLSQDATFQDTIRRTMARMKESGDQATAAAASKTDNDFLAEMMKAMGDMPSGDSNDEDFSKMLMGMMEQLTNKEILYEPMKELHEKYPSWMTKNKDSLPAEDWERYKKQEVLVKEMVTKFEEPTYADSNPTDREYIVDRMQKMQELGAPPNDLVGDMPSAKDVLDGPDDESCAPQ
ncbi:Pex19 protein [Xylariaceae sp. FL0016]|nr:Pex19 protein [Xylariaceae sp. FL0016]